MNSYQIARQIAHLLSAREWSGDSSNQTVFGRVMITAERLESLIVGNRMPIAVVSIKDADNDPEFPEIEIMRFGVTVVAAGRNDPHGEAALVGGVRTSMGASGGRGTSELVKEVKAVLQRNDGENGIAVLSFARGSAASLFVDGHVYAAQEVEIQARGGTALYYHPARKIQKSGSTVSWTLPPDRFDRLKVVLRYASGSTAPTSVTGGSGATLSGNLATSYVHGTDGQGAGTFSYSLFSQYDDTGAGSVTGTSSKISLTGAF